MDAKLVPLSIGPEKHITVVVHGYGVVKSEQQFERIAQPILAARPAGRVYLMYWQSGNIRMPPWVLAAATAARIARISTSTAILGPAAVAGEVLMQIWDFKKHEAMAEELGQRFKRHLSRIPFARDYPVNLIGYSLGARVIHYALAFNDWNNYKLKDCVLLAGAADAEDEDWPECAEKLSGKIYNAYSEKDGILKVKPDFRLAIGRHGILWRHPQIVNRKYQLGHFDYMPEFEYLLQRLWSGFEQSPQALPEQQAEVACPYCHVGLNVQIGREVTCPDCGLYFEFDGKDVWLIENLIVCPGRRCGYVGKILPEPGYLYECPECGATMLEVV